MREINAEELEQVDGGILYYAVGVVLTAIAIADGVNDFVDGYRAAMAD